MACMDSCTCSDASCRTMHVRSMALPRRHAYASVHVRHASGSEMNPLGIEPIEQILSVRSEGCSALVLLNVRIGSDEPKLSFYFDASSK